jgi:hypothetical protein
MGDKTSRQRRNHHSIEQLQDRSPPGFRWHRKPSFREE